MSDRSPAEYYDRMRAKAADLAIVVADLPHAIARMEADTEADINTTDGFLWIVSEGSPLAGTTPLDNYLSPLAKAAKAGVHAPSM